MHKNKYLLIPWTTPIRHLRLECLLKLNTIYIILLGIFFIPKNSCDFMPDKFWDLFYFSACKFLAKKLAMHLNSNMLPYKKINESYFHYGCTIDQLTRNKGEIQKLKKIIFDNTVTHKQNEETNISRDHCLKKSYLNWQRKMFSFLRTSIFRTKMKKWGNTSSFMNDF